MSVGCAGVGKGNVWDRWCAPYAPRSVACLHIVRVMSNFQNGVAARSPDINGFQCNLVPASSRINKVASHYSDTILTISDWLHGRV